MGFGQAMFKVALVVAMLAGWVLAYVSPPWWVTTAVASILAVYLGFLRLLWYLED